MFSDGQLIRIIQSGGLRFPLSLFLRDEMEFSLLFFSVEKKRSV